MPGRARTNGPVLGCRVKSGRAIAVLLGGTAADPRVLDRTELVLCDPRDPSTRQPYHARTGTLETDSARIARRVAAVERAAERSVAQAFAAWSVVCRRAALVVGSATDPERIANEHIRAHAHEGRLFPRALAEALARHAVATSTVVEKELAASASQALALSAETLAVRLAELGRAAGRPWRAEHKSAALAAWMSLGRAAR